MERIATATVGGQSKERERRYEQLAQGAAAKIAAFVSLVTKELGSEKGHAAAIAWISELENSKWLGPPDHPDWRKITIKCTVHLAEELLVHSHRCHEGNLLLLLATWPTDSARNAIS
jgi:hypothetical protein